MKGLRGQDRIRTGVVGVADQSLATRPPDHFQLRIVKVIFFYSCANASEKKISSPFL